MKTTAQKGFTLLYAMLVVAAVISVTAAVAGVLVRELKLSDTRQRSLEAYYAAQSGLECAYSWSLQRTPFDGSTDIECDGVTLANVGGNFTIDGSFCADVTVTPGDPVSIVSKGYDTCSAARRQVERTVSIEHAELPPPAVAIAPPSPSAGCTIPSANGWHKGIAIGDSEYDAMSAQGLDCGMLLHLTFDTWVGNEAQDTSGFGNHAVFSGDSTYESVSGRIGQAVRLDGVREKLVSSSYMNLNGDFTMTFWARGVDWSDGSRGLVGKEDAYKIKAIPTGVQSMVKAVYGGAPLGPDVDIPTSLSNNTWHFFALRFDSTGTYPFSTFINSGSPHPQGTDDSRGDTPYPSTNHLWIGCWTVSGTVCYNGTAPNPAAANGGHFNGDIDDIRIYGRTLTNAEIALLRSM